MVIKGREKEVIILSTVRSNPEGKIGFMSDHRRMNVAITRAKRGLVVIGDPATLGQHPMWKAWIDFLKEKKLIVDSKQVIYQWKKQKKEKKTK